MDKQQRSLINFFFELLMLKKIEHCGTKFAGVKHPDSLGEHSCIAGIIGYTIARMERADGAQVSLMCLFHDIGEIRIGDAHLIARRYIDTLKGERMAVQEQTEPLPKNIKSELRSLWDEFHKQKTLESHCARDADLLETMLQAKEYLDSGHRAAGRWLRNGAKSLKTKTAKKLYRALTKTAFTDWWDKLNRF